MTSNAFGTSSDWSITYVGDAVQDNTIDALDLADALRATHSLLVGSNEIVNGDSASASLRIKTTSPGSFEIEFLLQIATHAISQAGFVVDAIELSRYLVGGAGAIGVFELFKRFRGRIPRPSDAEDLISAFAGDSGIDVPVEVARIVSHSNSRMALRSIVDPLNGRGVTELRINGGGDDSFSISEDDIDPEYWSELEDETQNTIVIPSQRLKVGSPNLERSRIKWRLSDGNAPHLYTMADLEFLGRVADGDVRFGTGDTIDCSVTIVQHITGAGKIRSEYIVTKVLHYHDGGRQLSFLEPTA